MLLSDLWPSLRDRMTNAQGVSSAYIRERTGANRDEMGEFMREHGAVLMDGKWRLPQFKRKQVDQFRHRRLDS